MSMETPVAGEPIAALENQAQELARQSKWRAAARALMRAARAEPENTDRWLQIAQWQRQDRDSKAAARTLRTALRLTPAVLVGTPPLRKRPTEATIKLWQALAETQLEAQAWNECIAACEKLLELAPNHHFGLEVLATALLYGGQVEAASTVMRKLLVLSPRDPLHRLKLATLLHLQGRLGEAVSEFQRVARSFPDAPFAEEAHEAIEALDRLQIQQILARAAEETNFQHRLEQDMEGVVVESGYFLSEAGSESLRHLLADGRPEINPATRYH